MHFCHKYMVFNPTIKVDFTKLFSNLKEKVATCVDCVAARSEDSCTRLCRFTLYFNTASSQYAYNEWQGRWAIRLRYAGQVSETGQSLQNWAGMSRKDFLKE